MEVLQFSYKATEKIKKQAHVGVVGSGNLEVLLEPAGDAAQVTVTTSLDGNKEIWDCVLQRFFAEHPICVNMEINDFGATPGVVQLRLMQAWEVCSNED